MKRWGVVKTTIVGGVLVLLPLVVLALVVGKAVQISLLVAEPLGRILPIDTLAGVAIADVLAVLAIVAVCYLAGLAARIEVFKKKSARLEEFLVASLPGYTFAKTVLTGLAKADDEVGRMKPILVTLDDMRQIAFEVERTSAGLVVVYLPGAPNPWSGTVGYFTTDRVEALDMRPHEAVKLIRTLGRNSARCLPGQKPAANPTDRP